MVSLTHLLAPREDMDVKSQWSSVELELKRDSQIFSVLMELDEILYKEIGKQKRSKFHSCATNLSTALLSFPPSRQEKKVQLSYITCPESQ